MADQKIFYIITRNSADDFELWTTTTPDKDDTGVSTRGTLAEIREELDSYLDSEGAL